MVRRGAGFDTNQTRRQLLKESQHVAALELTTEHDSALRIDAMELKHRLRDIETDCRDCLYDLSPPNRGGPNSTHLYGTHVPVEEVSVAGNMSDGHAVRINLSGLWLELAPPAIMGIRAQLSSLDPRPQRPCAGPGLSCAGRPSSIVFFHSRTSAGFQLLFLWQRRRLCCFIPTRRLGGSPRIEPSRLPDREAHD